MGDLEVRLRYKKDETDDWTRIEDKALRKKIQNRLAKRKSRKDAPKSRAPKIRAVLGQSPPNSSESTETSRESPETSSENKENASIANAIRTGALNEIIATSAHRADAMSRRKNSIRAYLEASGLSEHHHISLTQYSLLRAFVANAQLLAIPFSLFEDDDSLSPWTLMHPYPAIGSHTLGPTPLQLCTPHHPFIDVIASPSLRDRIILDISDDETENQFCEDMHTETITVWGSQPWSPMSWEVSQTFVNKWAWLLDDETLRSSNFWRAERGEAALVIPDMESREVREGF